MPNINDLLTKSSILSAGISSLAQDIEVTEFQSIAKEFIEELEMMPVSLQDILTLELYKTDCFYHPWLFLALSADSYQQTELCKLAGLEIQMEWLEIVNNHYRILESKIGVLVQTYQKSNELGIDYVAWRFRKHFYCYCESLAKDWEEIQKRCEQILVSQNQVKRKPSNQLEKQLEQELYLWLLANKVEVERQVSTKKHRFDLWIPGHCFLELKAAKVTGDDVCQALDYYSHYRKKVIITGKSLSNGASRGLEAISNLLGDDAVVFITWGAAKDYLSRIIGF